MGFALMVPAAGCHNSIGLGIGNPIASFCQGQGAFSNIFFAIADWSTERRTLGVFRDVFSPGT
jgi:hypothetical protein